MSEVELRQCISFGDLCVLSRLIDSEFWARKISIDKHYFERVTLQLQHKISCSRFARNMPVSPAYISLAMAHVLKGIVSYRKTLSPEERADVSAKLAICKHLFAYDEQVFKHDEREVTGWIEHLEQQCKQQNIVFEPVAERECLFPYKAAP